MRLSLRGSLRVASPRTFAHARVYFARPTITIAKIRDYSQFTFTLLNTREMKLFGVSSLLRCAFFRIRLGIPGVIACSTFASNLFLLFGGIFSAEMIQALPPVLCHCHRFVTFFVGGEGGGGGLVYCLLQNISQSTVLYYPFLFPSVKLLNVDVRRNESLFFITNFEVLNLND